MDKRELRRSLRRARRQISPAHSRLAAERLRRLALREGLLRYRRIAFYLPFDGEMSLLPLLNQALWLGKNCYLPVVPRRFERQLRFSRLSGLPRWYLNRFGIHEHWSPRPLRARQLDLLLMPLVGFDESGHRLGMGGGFYDATLAYLRRRKSWRKPLLVGVGYECQKVPHLPHDPWDIRLDGVITEEKIYWSRKVGMTCVTG